MSDAEEQVRVVANVPKSVKEAAKEKLEYGGLSREIESTLQRIAFGEDLNQRGRLKRQRADLKEDLMEKRERRRELDAEIENVEQRIQSITESMNNLTTREDKYEAKLEALEQRLRVEGSRLDPKHSAVVEAANTGGVEPEGVVKTLKSRNPDVPVYAFKDGLHDRHTWDGLPVDIAELPVDKRESLD